VGKLMKRSFIVGRLRLQGDVQETQYLEQRGPTGAEETSAAEVANVETRLGEMEHKLGVTPPYEVCRSPLRQHLTQRLCDCWYQPGPQ
jgi:hypothetical protein